MSAEPSETKQWLLIGGPADGKVVKEAGTTHTVGGHTYHEEIFILDGRTYTVGTLDAGYFLPSDTSQRIFNSGMQGMPW